jgi:FkbM family methyltransferase
MTIIEIGSYDGNDTLKYTSLPNSNVWSFEPNTENIIMLNKKFENVTNVKIIPKAVGIYNGKTKFNVSLKVNADKLSHSSSINDLSEYTIKNGLIKFTHQIEVDIIRMDTFIEENDIKEIDYFHCDAQGSDFDILKSFGDKIKIIKKGQVEGCRIENMYNTENLVVNIISFLEEKGFIISNKNQIEQDKWHDVNIKFFKKELLSII